MAPISSVTGQFSSLVSGLGIEISMVTIGWAVAFLFLGWLVNRFSDLLIARAVKRRGGGSHASKSAQKVSKYVIYSLTFVVVLGVLGVPLSALGASIGLIGLGISFALKDLIANFISGIFILVNQPFKIGDQIEVAGESGTVKDIQVRATELRTYDGRKVIVPNSTLYNDTVINDTAYDQRRFDVIVGVGYEEDIEKAKELAMETMMNAENVHNDPEPQVLVDELGGSSVNLKLRCWTEPKRGKMLDASSEVTQGVKERYDEAGIDIPFPIRTVFLNKE